MSYKKATYISLLLCAVIAVIFYITALNFPSSPMGASFGPDAFPKTISILILITCVISFILTMKQEDEKVEIENIKYVVITVILTVMFTLLWQMFGIIYGMFYLLAFLFLATLLYIYNQAPRSKRKISLSLGVSFIITISVYILFERLLGIVFH